MYLGGDSIVEPYFEACNACITCGCISDWEVWCTNNWNPQLCPYTQENFDDLTKTLPYADDGERCDGCEEGPEDKPLERPPSNKANYTAIVIAMTNDGRIRWQLKLSGRSTEGRYNMDRCMGIAYNDVTGDIAVLLTATGYELRQHAFIDEHQDPVLIILSHMGELQSAKSIARSGLLKVDTFIAPGGLLHQPGTDNYYFAGRANGTHTRS